MLNFEIVGDTSVLCSPLTPPSPQSYAAIVVWWKRCCGGDLREEQTRGGRERERRGGFGVLGVVTGEREWV